MSDPRPKFWKRIGQLFALAMLALGVAFLAELFFQPFASRRFLLLAVHADETRFYAQSSGIIFGILLNAFFWFSRNTENMQKEFGSRWGAIQFMLVLVSSPIIGYVAGWMIVTKAVPTVRHHFAPQSEVEVPFTITGFSFSRRCRGVYAVNPAFYDEKICGVRRWGHSDEWRGRTILVTGMQSRYGMVMERYRIEPPVPPPNDD